MNLAHKTTKVQIVGASGTGKSSFFLSYFLKAQHGQKFLFDHEGEFTQRIAMLFASRQMDSESVAFCSTMEELTEGMKKPVVIFDPAEMFEGALPDAFDFFCDVVFTHAKESDDAVERLFACDELQNLIGTDVVTPYLAKVLETGRRYTLDWLGISQGLNVIHNRVRNQITNLVVFRTTDEKPLETLEAKGFDRSEVMSLRDFNFLEKNLKTGEIVKGSFERIA